VSSVTQVSINITPVCGKMARHVIYSFKAIFNLNQKMKTIHSSAFGEFNPFEPQTISGLFAGNLYANPLVIDAPIDLVWSIMTGFDKYPEWNPLNRFFNLDSEAAPNHYVTFGPSWGPYHPDHDRPLPEADMIQHEMITVWEKNHCLAYADIRPYLKAERVQHISGLEDGSTRYHTYERLSGIVSPIVRWKFGSRILAGFEANGMALKKRAEMLSQKT
jgi:hypothetical protein